MRKKKPLIEKLGLEQEIRGMRDTGLGYKNISKQLKAQGHSLSWMTIKNWLDRENILTNDMITEDKKLSEKREQEWINSVQQLQTTNTMLNSLMERMEQSLANKDFTTLGLKELIKIDKLIKVADAIRRQLEYQAKVLGMIETGTKEVKQQIFTNSVQMGIEVNKYLVKLEQLGYIKIYKEPKGAV